MAGSDIRAKTLTVSGVISAGPARLAAVHYMGHTSTGVGKFNEATLMAKTTITWTNRRVKASANWNNISEATLEVNEDIGAAYSNSLLALVNDAYMTGNFTTTVSYVNSTCVEATHTLSGNTTFVNQTKSDHEDHKALLVPYGYTITEV